MSGVSKVNKKSNLEKLLQELFEKEIQDQNPEAEIVSAGHPNIATETMSDNAMSAWLVSTYGGTTNVPNVSAELNEQLAEDMFENIEEKTNASSITVKI
ncbi:hypothetical protein EBU71_06370 [bacterium]|nr:hypothetical protein [Candidatus Elulimicrobium humile]